MELRCPRCDEAIDVDVDSYEGEENPAVQCSCGYKFILKLVKPKLKVDPSLMEGDGGEEGVPVIMEKVGRRVPPSASPDLVEYSLLVKGVDDKASITKTARLLLSLPGETRKLRDIERLLNGNVPYVTRGLSKAEADDIRKSFEGLKVNYTIESAKEVFCEEHGKARIQLCPHCGRGVCPDCTGDSWVCEGCGEEISLKEMIETTSRGEVAAGGKRGGERRIAPSEVEGIVLATLPAIDGRRIAEVLGVVAVEYIIPEACLRKIMSISREDVPAKGEDSRAAEEAGQLRERAFDVLRKKAEAFGANAVLGLAFSHTFPHSDFLGKGVLVLISGTAVRLM